MNKTFKAPHFLNLTIAAAFATLTPFVIPPHAAKAFGKGTCRVEIRVSNESPRTIEILSLRVAQRQKQKTDWDTENLKNKLLNQNDSWTYKENLTVDEGNDFTIVPRFKVLESTTKGAKWTKMIEGEDYHFKNCFDGKKVTIKIDKAYE
jgi:hypothetical protein